MTEHTAASPFPGEVAQLGEGVYAYVQADGGWCLNNAGIVVGDGGTVLVDTAATEWRARMLHEAVRTVSRRPVAFVVNTHSHGDHTFGNAEFAGEATVIAHERAAADMAAHGLALTGLWPDVAWGNIRLRLPDLTFSARMALPSIGPRIELLHFGPGHTAGDTVVWLPDQRVLFTGDLVFSGVTPFILMGSLSGTLRLLDRLRALEPLHVVPGHGPVGGPELLDLDAGYLRWIRGLARSAVAEGVTPLDVARSVGTGPYSRLLDSERLVGNLIRACAEERGLAPAAPLDVRAAFEEMVTFNGGLPRCGA
ncbi:MBL fold metallo-hydrolase [Streptomyces albireticuli]|uniref:MBL fold metallo-hydrolase n=1 Tax=Streptomyces albireticuli TaxID=1940 RepID=UPI0036B971A2